MDTHSTIERIDQKQSGAARWGGMLLFLLGVLLFSLNVMKYRAENWWAIFIALPALALFGLARILHRDENGRYSLAARVLTGSGLLIGVVAGMFLLNVSWAAGWPLMIITPGLALAYAAGRTGQNPTTAAWIRTTRWLSASMISLGGLFLAYTMNVVDLDAFGEFHWWGLFVALPALGALLNGTRLFLRLGYPSLSVLGLWLIAFFTGITAVIELLGISWSAVYSVTAVFLIAGGVLLVVNGIRGVKE